MAQMTFIKPGTKIKFVEHHKPVMAIMLLLCVAGLIYAFIHGPNWGTSFQGGTSINIHFNSETPIATEAVKTAFVEDDAFDHVAVQTMGSDGENKFVVRTRTTTTMSCPKFAQVHQAFNGELQKVTGNASLTLNEASWPLCNDDGIRGNFDIGIQDEQGNAVLNLTPDQIKTAIMAAGFDEVQVAFNDIRGQYTVRPEGIQSKVNELLSAKFGTQFDVKSGIDGVSTIGADVGEKFRTDAIVSILLALGFMLLYIAFRFDTRYAPSAVISLTVTTLLTCVFIVFMNIEITLETVAARLSLVGYGINDTIVNFDRIRENVALSDKSTSVDQLVNQSINECISRTVITSITTLLAIVPLIIFATGTTRDFAIIMAFGICVATLNSMFISCPFVIKFDKWFKLYKERAAEKAEGRKLLEADIASDALVPEVVDAEPVKKAESI